MIIFIAGMAIETHVNIAMIGPGAKKTFIYS